MAAHYTWAPEQTTLLNVEFAKGRHFTVNYLMRHLQRHGMLLGCTDEDMKQLCNAMNKRNQRWAKDDMNLEMLHAIVKDYGDTDGGDDDNAPDDNKPYLLELPGGANHILV